MSRRRLPLASPLGRRQLLAGASLLLPAIVAGCAGVETATGAAAAREATLPADAPVLYFVTAGDCVSCAKWKTLFRAGFEASPERAKLRFVILNSPTIRTSSYADSIWPEDLRWISAELSRRNPRYTYPTFVLVHNRTVVEAAFGEWDNAPHGWKGDLPTAIRKETGTL